MFEKIIVTTKDISAPFLSLLRIVGCHPKEKSISGPIIYWILSSTGVIYIFCSFVKCIQQNTLESFALNYIDFLIASQTTIKAISIHMNQNKFEKLLDVFWDDFWPVDKLPKHTEKHNQMYRLIIRGINAYRYILVVCILQISLYSLITSSGGLAYKLYLFGYEDNLLLTTPYYQITYLIEMMTLTVAYLVCLTPYDMIFIAMCGTTIVQFNILIHKFLEIGEDEADEQKLYDNLKECVKQHNMLLRFVKDLDNLLTIPILYQYVNAITLLGVYVYLFQDNFNFLYGFSLLTTLAQTLFFSSFGQFIQDRSFAVGDAAYSSKWHLVNSRRVRQAVSLVILRAQKPNYISAGGFIDLSFESFVGMVKAAGSFLAVLRSTKN